MLACFVVTHSCHCVSQLWPWADGSVGLDLVGTTHDKDLPALLLSGVTGWADVFVSGLGSARSLAKASVEA